MTDHDALLQAVLHNPKSDLERLVYADFLDERGEGSDRDRAIYIRCEIAAPVTKVRRCDKEVIDLACRVPNHLGLGYLDVVGPLDP